MATVANLLERKQTLLERMDREHDPDKRGKIERDLREINDELNQIEADELDAPIAPEQVASRS
jgi:hypothetical protein